MARAALPWPGDTSRHWIPSASLVWSTSESQTVGKNSGSEGLGVLHM